MNSKKLVSLLSAGALVVSSFSGLALHSGVAFAAADAEVTTIGVDPSGDVTVTTPFAFDEDGAAAAIDPDGDAVEVKLTGKEIYSYSASHSLKATADWTGVPAHGFVVDAPEGGADDDITFGDADFDVKEATADSQAVEYTVIATVKTTAVEGDYVVTAPGDDTFTITVGYGVGLDGDGNVAEEAYQIGLYRDPNSANWDAGWVDEDGNEVKQVDPTEPIEVELDEFEGTAEYVGYISYVDNAAAVAALPLWQDMYDEEGFAEVTSIAGNAAGAPHFRYVVDGGATVEITNIAADDNMIKFTFEITSEFASTLQVAVVDEILINRIFIIGGRLDISNDVAIVQVGYENNTTIQSWPVSDTRQFEIKKDKFLKDTFGQNLTDYTLLDIEWSLIANPDAAGNPGAKGTGAFSIVGGDNRVNNLKVKHQTNFDAITVTGVDSVDWVLQARGVADVTYMVNGAPVRQQYGFIKQVQIVHGDALVDYVANGFGTEVRNNRVYEQLTVNVLETATIRGIYDDVAVPAGAATMRVEYRLENSKYVTINGSSTSDGARLTYGPAAAALQGPSIQFTLTAAGKAAVHDIDTYMDIDMIYLNALGNQVFAGTTRVYLVVKANTDFQITMKDVTGADYPDTIEWLVDDEIFNTKLTKEFIVRSATSGVDLGANGVATNVYFEDNANFKVQYQNRNEVWNDTAAGVGYPTVAGAATDGTVVTGLYRIRFSGATNVTGTVKLTAVYGTGVSLKRATRSYSMKSVVAGVDIQTQEYWAVGETLNLRTDVVVKYNGEAVTDQSLLTWTVSGVDNSEISKNGDSLKIVKDGEKFNINVTYRKVATNTTAQASKEIKTVKKLTLSGVDANLTMLVGESIDLASAIYATGATSVASADAAVARVIGTTVTGMKAGATTLRLEDANHNYAVVNLTVSGSSVDPSEHYAGEPVAEDGVVGYLNEDLKTVTVTDVAVVSKAITIPATVQGFDVVAIDAQAFKKSDAKTVYVKGSVDTIGKGAFKASKVKKVYFYDPAALKTVGKNAFKKTNAKVVGVGAAFSDEVASDLKKAGASKVKNNGTAK